MIIAPIYTQLVALLVPRGDHPEVMDGRTHLDLLNEAVEWVAVHVELPLSVAMMRAETVNQVRRKYNALIKGARIRAERYAKDLPTEEEQERLQSQDE